MKLKASIVASIIALSAVAGQAQAAGCLKGAVAGAVASHFVGKGHAVAGAVGVCIVGRHYAKAKADAAACTPAQKGRRSTKLSLQLGACAGLFL
jgi:hypothetical protein